MKRIISLILCLSFLFSLCGCTDSAPSDTSELTQSVSSATSVNITSSGISSSSSSAVSSESKIPHASSAVSSKVSVSHTSSVATTVEKEWFTEGDVIFTAADLKKAQTQKFTKPKNVIILIGDGMGLNDIAITNKFGDALFDFGLVLDRLPNIGEATTNSLTGVTDSAASATALATGTKTNNTYVGIDKDNRTLKNPAELARELGKKVGIVTTDVLHGATPAAFTVHSSSRYNTAEILLKQAVLAPDVLIGDVYGFSDFKNNVPQNIMAKFNIAPLNTVWNEKLNADPKGEKPFLGFMGVNHSSANNTLAQGTEVALNRLENNKGFFLMVECSTTDKGGHDNNLNKKIVGVSNLDKAVAVAVKYCLSHPDTVLIVTSDHETGGVSLPDGEYDLSDVSFTTTNHTGVNVGVFALGYGTEYFKDKTVDNTDIAKFIHAALKGEAYK